MWFSLDLRFQVNKNVIALDDGSLIQSSQQLHVKNVWHNQRRRKARVTLNIIIWSRYPSSCESINGPHHLLTWGQSCCFYYFYQSCYKVSVWNFSLLSTQLLIKIVKSLYFVYSSFKTFQKSCNKHSITSMEKISAFSPHFHACNETPTIQCRLLSVDTQKSFGRRKWCLDKRFVQ